MIRRFFTMLVFVITVGVAAFGQDIFGRDDLIRLGQRLQAEAPAKAEIAMKKTDVMLAALVPEAGIDPSGVCTFDELQWATHFHSQTIRM